MSGEGAEEEESGEKAPSCLRGSPERIKDLMEQYQQAYVLSVASAAGCVLSEPRLDEGVDVFLTHRADVHLSDHVARLEIQLKATARKLSADGSRISASVERKRYDYFRSRQLRRLPRRVGDTLAAQRHTLLSGSWRQHIWGRPRLAVTP
jgi:hypothetical protein